MKRALAFTALLCACGETGLTVDVSAKADVPRLDGVRVQVVQGPLLVEQTFMLGALELPQSVAIVSKGLTRGTVEVTVQGLSGGRVEALGHATGDLKHASEAQRVPVLLERFCLPGKAGCGCTPAACGDKPKTCGRLDDGCGGTHECGSCASGETCSGNTCTTSACTRKTCAQLGLDCGRTLDGCGGVLDCGTCASTLTCGGGGKANVCGPGSCSKATRCDAGLQCGSASDGCGDLISCGTCDAGACGVDNRCPCTPATRCPPAKECGLFSNGCPGGGMIDCGACTLPEVCMNNTCRCVPKTVCDPLECGQQPDGCNGTLTCTTPCPAGRTCGSRDGGAPRCNCLPGTTECNGACVDLMTSAGNCGACGNTCPGGQSCHGGLCPCVDAGSNLDGHCCPGGWVLAPTLNNPTSMGCYRGPFDAGTEAEGLAQCAAETKAGFGRAVSALGAGRNGGSASAAPAGACGSFLLGLNEVVIDAETAGFGGSQTCVPLCTGTSCVCTTCTCQGTGRACSQRYYCVMDPLGPRVEGPCTANGECPPGMQCNGGNCVDAGAPYCVIDTDCDAGTFPNCNGRGGQSHTGLCN